jgi:hypothetical protein
MVLKLHNISSVWTNKRVTSESKRTLILRRQRGWFLRRLNEYPKTSQVSFDLKPNVDFMISTCGVKYSYAKRLMRLFETNRHHSYRRIIDIRVRRGFWDCLHRCIMPVDMNVLLLIRIYWIYWLLARSYRARRHAICRPAHGQRRWSNAEVAKYRHHFMFDSVTAYEYELFGFRTRKYVRYTKAMEMRLKSKTKIKKKVKKLPKKFKKATDKALVKKYKKKTPWH